MNRFPLPFALVLALGVAACSHRPIPAPGMPTDDLEAISSGPILADPSLSGELEIGQIQAMRTDTDRLRITIPLNNVSGERLQLLCKVVFKDGAGVAIPGDETSHQYVSAPIGLTRKSFTSLKPQATKYEVQIRRYEQ